MGTPVQSQGQKTRARLLQAAAASFQAVGYHRTSVASICRRAGLANGTFYRYFPDKESIFLELAGEWGRSLHETSMAAARGAGSFEARYRAATQAYFRFIRENPELYRIFREAEFVDARIPAVFYHRLARLNQQMVAEGIASGELRPTDQRLVGYYLIGLHYLVGIRWLVWGPGELPPEIIEALTDLALHGLDTGQPWPRTDGEEAARLAIAAAEDAPSPRSPVLGWTGGTAPGAPEGSNTRERLLQAATETVARKGYHGASVMEICLRAGVALGTFYIHFSSKEALLEELVRAIGHDLRRYLQRIVSGLEDRRQVEVAGLGAFFRYVKAHPEIYRIVREAEFVDPTVAQQYYHRLARGYVRGVQEGMEQGTLRPMHAEALTYALMGVAHFLGVYGLLFPGSPWTEEPLSDRLLLEGTVDLLRFGLAARG